MDTVFSSWHAYQLSAWCSATGCLLVCAARLPFPIRNPHLSVGNVDLTDLYLETDHIVDHIFCPPPLVAGGVPVLP